MSSIPTDNRVHLCAAGPLLLRAGRRCRRNTPFPSARRRWRKPNNTARAWRTRITRTFRSSPGFCPKHLHQHFYNVYAYCRISDDLGDEVGDPQQSLALLDAWEAELNATYMSLVPERLKPESF